ncbi:hypothetical protein SELMODRAFT_405259 [Selaginella moellendorffii]|uniref:Uncharacterized protein MS5B-1 n=1 Tax=Selaginella moellendorffii TaxID=88036 RepID=D8QWS5_SELML|nr:protein SULFUR DEFICIENCY-INDUCED 2 [Selaginella moellendorffii]EFJ35689.1 hypothetical protein SELMODRAFT_405259 [Selaginella moellendorffii]|eukprot:XP_002963818.1 protein SULFUR DEFICIENCY-INDUCED 2 [Selaginella moellendorffii]
MWIDRYNLDSASFQESFHVLHKIPVGDTPYVKAKHVQLVDKDPDRAIALFWAAINAGDRVDSALKDMAIVMKQQNRPEEAIEAIKSLRDRCTDQAQEALDNVLLDLYKRCGRLDDQIALLKRKLHLIHEGLAFNGKRTKTARSQGRKFQVSIEQEASRLLGNLGWAYMQQSNYIAAEAVYRKALSIEPDSNKVCNLGICFQKQGKLHDARVTLESVAPPAWNASPSQRKTYERAQEVLVELREMKSVQRKSAKATTSSVELNVDESSWNPLSSPARTSLKHHLPEILAATSGFSDDGDDNETSEAKISRKRSYETENEQHETIWSPPSSSEQESRLPLTSDWTNKAYARQSPASSLEKPKKALDQSVTWKDVLLQDDRAAAARRSLASSFDSADDALLRDLEETTARDRELQSVEECDQGWTGRRLKVFEEMTLPGLLL